MRDTRRRPVYEGEEPCFFCLSMGYECPPRIEPSHGKVHRRHDVHEHRDPSKDLHLRSMDSRSRHYRKDI